MMMMCDFCLLLLMRMNEVEQQGGYCGNIILLDLLSTSSLVVESRRQVGPELYQYFALSSIPSQI